MTEQRRFLIVNFERKEVFHVKLFQWPYLKPFQVVHLFDNKSTS